MIDLRRQMPHIERCYARWLNRMDDAAGDRPVDVQSAAAPAMQTRAVARPPAWVQDMIRRQVQARPALRSASSGDVVLFSPDQGGRPGDDGLPLLMLLDGNLGSYWSGWLVGAHPDYAGNQDLVLERRLLCDGQNPAPLAAMVQTWNRVHLHLHSPVPVLHRLTPAAMAAARALAMAGIEPDAASAPGRMRTRQMAGLEVITGTPFGKHDPRDAYLLLSRQLSDILSEPLLEREDREYGDDEPDYS